MNIATTNEEIQFASWEKPFRRHVIKYPSCNIFTQLSGRVEKTYIANRVHSYIENSGIRKIALFTLDNHEAVAELCKSVNLKSMTYREENIPYEEENGGRWVKKEPIDRSAGKIREIDLVHFDDLFNIILEYKDNANYIIDVPCWATTAFHEYAVSMEIRANASNSENSL